MAGNINILHYPSRGLWKMNLYGKGPDPRLGNTYLRNLINRIIEKHHRKKCNGKLDRFELEIWCT